MMYKLYDEDGDYIDNETGERRNLQSCGTAYTPEGINVGWTEFNNDAEAMEYFNIRYSPKNGVAQYVLEKLRYIEPMVDNYEAKFEINNLINYLSCI